MSNPFDPFDPIPPSIRAMLAAAKAHEELRRSLAPVEGMRATQEIIASLVAAREANQRLGAYASRVDDINQRRFREDLYASAKMIEALQRSARLTEESAAMAQWRMLPSDHGIKTMVEAMERAKRDWTWSVNAVSGALDGAVRREVLTGPTLHLREAALAPSLAFGRFVRSTSGEPARITAATLVSIRVADRQLTSATVSTVAVLELPADPRSGEPLGTPAGGSGEQPSLMPGPSARSPDGNPTHGTGGPIVPFEDTVLEAHARSISFFDEQAAEFEAAGVTDAFSEESLLAASPKMRTVSLHEELLTLHVTINDIAQVTTSEVLFSLTVRATLAFVQLTFRRSLTGRHLVRPSMTFTSSSTRAPER